MTGCENLVLSVKIYRKRGTLLACSISAKQSFLVSIQFCDDLKCLSPIRCSIYSPFFTITIFAFFDFTSNRLPNSFALLRKFSCDDCCIHYKKKPHKAHGKDASNEQIIVIFTANILEHFFAQFFAGCTAVAY
uniref:Uncharacterized protein n=1 Tax=Parascaris univalens TaxID=6257 RepID=A0A914ZI07_PARUN